jgi:hypothetical protein
MRVQLTRPQHTLLNYRVPDLGLGYLATGLRRSGHEAVLHVPDAQGWKTERALAAIRSGSIDVVGMKVMTADLEACRDLHGAVLQEFPQLPIVLGGPHVCGAKESGFDQFPGLEYAFLGEARAEIAQTVELALALDIDVAAISVLVPLPGSDIFAQLPPDVAGRFTDCVFQNAVNHLAEVPPQELHATAARAFIRLNLKPSRALFCLKNMNSLYKWMHLGASCGRHLRNILRGQG